MKCREVLVDATPAQLASLADIMLKLGLAMVAVSPDPPLVVAVAQLRLAGKYPRLGTLCRPFTIILAFAQAENRGPVISAMADEAQRRMYPIMEHIPSAAPVLANVEPEGGVEGNPWAWAAAAIAGHFLFKPRP